MKDRLVTPSYCAILAANFLLYFGFWLLMPVLPFYLTEVFAASKTAVGAVLSCYTVAGLCIRPFSGYLLDTFARKPLYLLAYFVFHGHLRRLPRGWHVDVVHLVARCPRRIVRHGDGGRQHDSHRHHALLASWRRTGLLRTGQQHSHVHRAYGRTVPARRRFVLYRHFLYFAGFVPGRLRVCLAGTHALQAASEASAVVARPVYSCQGPPGGAEPADAVHSLRHDDPTTWPCTPVR